MKKVKVIFPDGSIAELDESQVSGAISAGAKRYTDSSPESNQKSTSMVFPDGSIADIPDNGIDGALKAGAIKKKDGSNGVVAVSNGTPVKSVPTTSQSESQIVSPNEAFLVNNPTGIKKPVVSVAGVAVPINAPIQDAAPIPQISSPENLAAQLQVRINNKSYSKDDIGVVAQSMGVSPNAASAFMNGHVGKGTVIHFDDIKVQKQDQLKGAVDQANRELGLNDNYAEVFGSADLAGAYLQKLQTLYATKANIQSIAAVQSSAQSNPILMGEGTAQVDNSESQQTANAAQQIKGIISNEIIDKISNDGSLNVDQKVKKIYSLVDNREKVNVEKAIDERLSPLRYMVNVAIGGNTTEDIDLLNANKAGIEFKVNQTLRNNINYNEAKKKSILEEYADKVQKQEISAEDKEANDYYAKQVAEIEDKNVQLSKQVQPNTTLYEKYPVLFQAALANSVNEFNAIKSGNVKGYEDGGYENTSLSEHLTAQGFDIKDQKVKDYLDGDNFKDYSFIGRPIENVIDVFKNTGKSLLDFTPLRDDATILAEKKRAELFSTQVGTNDEFKLTGAAEIGQNIGNTTGQVLGQGLLQVGTAGLGRMAGLSRVAAMNSAFWSSGTLTSYDQAYKDSYDFIDNPTGRTAYAGLIALANGASEKIFPEAKLFQIPGVKDNIAKLASKVSTKELTTELADELLGKAKNAFVDYAVKYGKNVGQETAEEVATDLFESGTRYIFGDPNIDASKAIQSAKNTAIQTAIGTSLIGGFGAHKDVQQERNTSSASTIYNAAIYHDAALDAINIGYQGNLYDATERDAKVAILNTARQSVGVMEKTEKLQGKELTRPQRELYVANLTAESVLKGQKEELDEVGQAEIDTKISNLQNQRKQILNGEVNIDDNGNIEPITISTPTTATVNQSISTEIGQPEGQSIEGAVQPSSESNIEGQSETTATVLEDAVPDITVGEMIGKVGTYKGEKGSFSQDGQSVIFKVDGQNKEYELGNVNEISNTAISDYGITHETSVVGFDDNGNIKVRDESYMNNFSNPLQAINRDADGNIVSVNLETTDGKKRTFRGNVAEDVAYNIHLKEITKDNETRNSFENFINEDAAVQNEINNATVSEPTTKIADTPNGEVQRETIQPKTVEDFANRIVAGEKLTEPEDLQYYENNKTEIENLLKQKQQTSTQQNEPSTVKETIEYADLPQNVKDIVDTYGNDNDKATFNNKLAEAGYGTDHDMESFGEESGVSFYKLNENETTNQQANTENKQGNVNTEETQPTNPATNQNPQQAEGGNIPPIDAFASTETIPAADGIGIIHAATEELRKEASLPAYGKEAQTFEEWDKEADERIRNGEMPALMDKLRNGYQPSAVEVRMVGKYVAYLKGVVERTKSNEDISRYHEAIQLSDSLGGTENARGLVARKGLFIDEGTLTDFLENEMEAAKVDVLTDEQKAMVEKEHTEIAAAQKVWEAERDRLNQQIKDLQAQQEIDKNKPKTKSTSTTKKTHEDYVKERQAIIAHLKEKLRKARSSTNVTIIPYAADLFAAAPDVARLVKSLVEEGVNKLGDVIDNIHDTLKDGIPDITKDDVRDLVAGVYNAPQRTKSQAAKELFELKMEAKLINKLVALQNGTQPKNNRQQIDYNKQIKDLRQQIAKFRKENVTDADKLEVLKNRYAAEIKKVEEELKTGSFLNPTPPPPKLKLDKAALAAKDRLIKLKNERQLRLIQEQYKNRTIPQKAMSHAADILNIPRALMTTLDFSAVLRQGVVPTISHPIMAAKAGIQMFKSAWTQQEYDRWFYDLENAENYNEMKESGLALTDNTNPNLTAREEDFMSNLAERVPIVGQQLKTPFGTVPGLNVIKKSERAYAAYINKMRVDLYNLYTSSMKDRGMTFENSPEQYKGVADYINNSTGRGSLGGYLNKIAPLLNGIFFSPRLIASRLNMLTYLVQPRFYKTVPREIRQAYFADMGKFIAVGIATLALAELGGDDDDEDLEVTVENDPRSTDFGKIKQGQTRWDIWGGFQQYIRIIAQVYTGERKSTNTGKIYDITGEGLFSQTRGDVIGAFARGKLAPVPAMAVDIFSGRTSMGDKILLDEWNGDNAKEKEIPISQYLKDHMLPLTFTGVKEAYDEKGVKALFNVGLPTVFGVGVQTYKK